MGQWGKVSLYEGMRILPHVATLWFAPIRPDSLIDAVYVLDSPTEDRLHEEYATAKMFVGKTYREYLEIVEKEGDNGTNDKR